MKRDMNETQLRITGKAWEIRHTLRKLAQSGNGQETLSDYLKKVCTQKNRQGDFRCRFY